jgi:molybdate transport system regulatory protein
MKPSTRNQFTGTVCSITRGEAVAVVNANRDGGQEITSSITSEAADDSDSQKAARSPVLVKSTEVAPAID